MSAPPRPLPTPDEAALLSLEQAELELLNAFLAIARAAARLYDAGRQDEALELRRKLQPGTRRASCAVRREIDRRTADAAPAQVIPFPPRGAR